MLLCASRGRASDSLPHARADADFFVTIPDNPCHAIQTEHEPAVIDREHSTATATFGTHFIHPAAERAVSMTYAGEL